MTFGLKHIYLLLFYLATHYSLKAQLQYEIAGTLKTDYGGSVQDMEVDQDGNFYITGQFQETIDLDFGPGVSNLTTLSTGMGGDLYLVKYDPSGNLIWKKRFGSTSSGDWVYEMEVDSLGNVYLAGSIGSPIDFDPDGSHYILNSTASGYSSLYVTKFSSTGNFLWAYTLGGINGSGINDFNIDSNGDLLIAGNYSYTVDFDPSPAIHNLSSLGTTPCAFFARYSPDFNLIMVKGLTSYSYAYSIIRYIETDSINNIYVAGDFYSTLDVDPSIDTNNLIAVGGKDIFFAKYDSLGNFIWGKSIGSSSTDDPSRMIIDNFGNIYLTGYVNATIDLDPGSGTKIVSPTGTSAGFICKYNHLGDFIWGGGIIGPGYSASFLDIAVDKNENIYATGALHNTADFDPSFGIESLTTYGLGDIVIAKYDSLGNFYWVNRFGNNQYQHGTRIVLQNDSIIWIGGLLSGTVDMNSSLVVSNITAGSTMNNAYFAKYKLDKCGLTSLQIDSVLNVSCIDSGYVAASVSGLITNPHDYTWSTLPITNDSATTVPTMGIYYVNYSDTLGCLINRGVFVDGPEPTTFNLQTTLVAPPNCRAGFQYEFYLNAFNNSCDAIPGSLVLVLDNLLSFDSSSIAPSFITGDTLIWDFSSLGYDSIPLNPIVYCTAVTSAFIGDTVCLNSYILPISGDVDTSNNTQSVCIPVVASYDPNIKQVTPQGWGPMGYISNNLKMTYTVHFQNTGTADAINIFILDTLDSNLDLNSLQVIASSHSVITEIFPGNVLKFKFNNIYLPDSVSNEPESHGYIQYEINQLPLLPAGTQLKNTAYIYFDNNPAVITNTVLNTIFDFTGIENTSRNESLLDIYPNPAEANIFLKVHTFTSIQVMDYFGKTLFEKTLFPGQQIVSIQHLPAGMYLIKAASSNKTQTFKLIKN